MVDAVHNDNLASPCDWCGRPGPGVRMSLQRIGLKPSRPLRTIPGLRTNDAMAGLLAHRSSSQAAFPERLLQWLYGLQLPAHSCGYSAEFTSASLLAFLAESTI